MTFTPEHTLFRDTVRAFVAAEIAPHLYAWDEAESFPRDLCRRAAHIGLLGLGYPEAYGSTAADGWYGLIATEEIARAGSGGLMAGLFSHTIGLPPIVTHGSETLKQRVVPGVLAGEKIAALAITEPSGGSEVARLRCTVRLETNNGDASGDHFIIDGDKTSITSGMRADWITLAVRTGADASQRGAAGNSLIAVPGDAPGLTRRPLAKMGWWCSDTAQLHFDHCRVPADHLIGAPNAGFRMVMENFNGKRLLMSAAAGTFAQVCNDEALDWARQRQTFGMALVEHQVTRHKLMDMRMRIASTQAWLHALVQRQEEGATDAEWGAEERVAALCLLKNHATQTMQWCADAAVQILGGMGYMRGTKSERIYREVKVMMIGGGAEEIMKQLAARQLGV